MKMFCVVVTVLLMIGCAGKPKLVEPSGDLSPVHSLQFDLNEREGFVND